jgi:hypothetical protein
MTISCLTPATIGHYLIVMDVIAATSLDAFSWVNVFAFTIAAVFVTLTPGADTALVVRTAAAASGRRAIEAGLGVDRSADAFFIAFGLRLALDRGQ